MLVFLIEWADAALTARDESSAKQCTYRSSEEWCDVVFSATNDGACVGFGTVLGAADGPSMTCERPAEIALRSFLLSNASPQVLAAAEATDEIAQMCMARFGYTWNMPRPAGQTPQSPIDLATKYSSVSKAIESHTSVDQFHISADGIIRYKLTRPGIVHTTVSGRSAYHVMPSLKLSGQSIVKN